MLVELTIEVNEESFVIVHQHDGNDVTCKRSIHRFNIMWTFLSHTHTVMILLWQLTSRCMETRTFHVFLLHVFPCVSISSQVTFLAKVGVGYTGDLALDDISFIPGSCSGKEVVVPERENSTAEKGEWKVLWKLYPTSVSSRSSGWGGAQIIQLPIQLPL